MAQNSGISRRHRRQKCLDVGSDNGVISYLLREQGGDWSSADLDDTAVASITELVKTNVYQLDGHKTEFEDDVFDKVVIVDYLEHIENDKGFMDEVYRVLKPGGELLINVPHITNNLLRKFRLAIGQTDEKHGHLRGLPSMISASSATASSMWWLIKHTRASLRNASIL